MANAPAPPNAINKNILPVHAGLAKFLPSPPNSILTSAIDTIDPSAHSTTVSNENATPPFALYAVMFHAETVMTDGRLSASITAVTANDRSFTLELFTPSLFRFFDFISEYSNSVTKQNIKHVTRFIIT